MNNREIVKTGFKKLPANALSTIAINFLTMVMCYIIPYIGIITGPLCKLMSSKCYLSIAQNKAHPFDDATSGIDFESFKKSFLITWVTIALTILGLLCLVLPGYFILIILFPSFYVLAEHKEEKVTDIIKATYKAMKGHRLQYITLCLEQAFFVILLYIALFGTIFMYKDSIFSVLPYAILSGLYLLLYVLVIYPAYYIADATFYNENIKPKIDQIFLKEVSNGRDNNL